ncbi:MAG: transcriptional regulator [Paracoccaceae bacterium]|jgi:transcriptional regulator
MHPNPAFRKTGVNLNIDFARSRGFGVLSVNGAEGPLVSHVPFLLLDDGAEAELHLVRSNPIAQVINAPTPAVIAVSGPDSYISPDWYGVDDQVPTWNYVAVHLRGILEPLPQDALHPMLDRLSAHFEELLQPKPPWTTDKMSDGVMDRMMRAIVPYKMVINSVNGTWKLNQNKDVSVRERASAHVLAHGIGIETEILSAMMLGAADR